MKKLWPNLSIYILVVLVIFFEACDDKLEDVSSNINAPEVSLKLPQETYAFGSNLTFEIEFKAKLGISMANIDLLVNDDIGVENYQIDLEKVGILNDTVGVFEHIILLEATEIADKGVIAVISLQDSKGRSSQDSVTFQVRKYNEPSVSINTQKNNYEIGETIELEVDFEAQSGIAGAVFYLMSDNNINFNPIVIDLNEEGVANDTLGNFQFEINVPNELAGSTISLRIEIEDTNGKKAQSEKFIAVNLPEAPSVNMTTTETNFNPNSEVLFMVDFEAEATLVELKFTLEVDNGLDFDPVLIDPHDFDIYRETSGNFEFRILLPDEINGANAVATIEIQDGLNRLATSSVEFEVVKSINVFTAQLLGGQSNPNSGSFFNAVDGVIYSVSEAFSSGNNEKNDLVFHYGNNIQYSIGSVDDSYVIAAFNAINVDLNLLNPKSTTRFKEFSTDIDFDAIQNESELLAAYQVGGASNLTNMQNLVPGKVFGIQLDVGRGARIGLVKVVATDGTSGADRSITIDVKIQSSDN
jgi:hypothetical protein